MPVTITNTHAVGVAHRATIDWAVTRFPDLGELWLLPVAAETYDGYLNDINGGHVTEQVVRSALDGARPGPVELGSAGGGTGMNCYGYKGGNGIGQPRDRGAGRPVHGRRVPAVQLRLAARAARSPACPWARRWPTTIRWASGSRRRPAPGR